MAQAIGGVISARRTRIKTDPSFLRAVEPRRAAVLEALGTVKPSRTRKAFVLTWEREIGIKRKHGMKWKESTTCTTSLCLVVRLKKQKSKQSYFLSSSAVTGLKYGFLLGAFGSANSTPAAPVTSTCPH